MINTKFLARHNGWYNSYLG